MKLSSTVTLLALTNLPTFCMAFGGGCNNDFISCDSDGVGTPRRQLKKVDQEFLADHLAKCADLDYRLSVFVDTHVALVAIPEDSNKAKEVGCEPMYFHLGIDEENKVSKKEVNGFHNENSPALTSGLVLAENLKFSTITEAFVATKQEELDISTYDFFNNNCATFVINMAKELGIQADNNEAIVEYVVEQLYENGATAKLRDSPNLNKLLGGLRKVVDDKKLMTMFVKHYIAEH